jgi:hypothetical protein
MRQYVELAVAAGIVVLTTAIATNIVPLPLSTTASPFATVILVIAALGAFSVSPVVGLALFVLTAVLFFKRNVHATQRRSVYGEKSIRQLPFKDAAPYEFQSSVPRQVNEFAETNPLNPMIGPLREGFEPAPYGDEAGAPVEGQYPKEQERPQGALSPMDYVYRPAPDTGSNEFERYGPELDEKLQAIEYTA